MGINAIEKYTATRPTDGFHPYTIKFYKRKEIIHFNVKYTYIYINFNNNKLKKLTTLSDFNCRILLLKLKTITIR